MNYATKRNLLLSAGIIFASLLLTAGLYLLIQTMNDSSLFTVEDSNAPIFSYIGATLGISVAIVASLSTIFLALQAMGIAKEHAIMSAREAYIDDIKDFRNDANEAERLILELTDKSLQHAQAVRKFMIFRLPDFNSNFEIFENDADIARELGNGVLTSALFNDHNEREALLRSAVESIIEECRTHFSIDHSDDPVDFVAEEEDIKRGIREYIEKVASVHLDTEEERAKFLESVKATVHSELLDTWRKRGEEAVTRSKAELLAAMSELVRFILARDRSFMFAELVERNIRKPSVEKAINWISDSVGTDDYTREPVHTGLNRLRYFVTAASGPSCVTDRDLKPNELQIPSRADGRLGESMHLADPFLPRIFRPDSVEKINDLRPHVEIEHLEFNEGKADVGAAMKKAGSLYKPLIKRGDYEFFSFLIMTLHEILDLGSARGAIETHLTATGMSEDLARLASESYARTIRPSVISKVIRHVPSVSVQEN